MQNDIFTNKTSGNAVSTRTTSTPSRRSLQDELMQELVQHKNSLEMLTVVDTTESNLHSGGRVAPELNTVPAANTLRSCVEQTLHKYFAQLDGQVVTNVYDMVLSEVEAPLLEVVMRNTMGNQCKAAELLGLSRGTLRKKLQQYGLL